MKKYRNDSIPTFFDILEDISNEIKGHLMPDQKDAVSDLIKHAVFQFKDCWEWLKKNNLLEVQTK